MDESQGDFLPSLIALRGDILVGKISGAMEDFIFLVLHLDLDFFEFAINNIVFWMVVQEIIIL